MDIETHYNGGYVNIIARPPSGQIQGGKPIWVGRLPVAVYEGILDRATQGLKSEIKELKAESERKSLLLIEERNPGIDMERVKHERTG